VYAIKAVRTDAGAGEFWTAMFQIKEGEVVSKVTSPSLSRSSTFRIVSTSTSENGQVSGLPSLAPFYKTAMPTPSLTPSSSTRAYDDSRWASLPGDLSSSAILGFVMGITLLVVVIIGFIVVTMFNRRQRKEEEVKKPKIAPLVPRQEGQVRGTDTQVYEPVPQEVYVSPVEMEGTRTFAELEAVGRMGVI
jgi:hypothetical protein